MATTVQPTTSETPSTLKQARPAAPAKAPWYRDPIRLGLAGVGALVVVALAAWLIISSNRRKEEFAMRALNQARATAESGNLPLASSELQRLIDTYRGTDAAQEAVLTLNQVRLINNQSELAAVNLREFLSRGPDRKYLAPANSLLGAALENAKRWDEAAQAYIRASEAAEYPFMKARYLLDAGRAYALGGKRDEAAKAFRTVVERYKDTPLLTEAEVRLAEVTAPRS